MHASIAWWGNPIFSVLTTIALMALTAPYAAAAGTGCEPGAACGECSAAAAVVEDEPAPGTPDAFQAFDRPNLSSSGALAFTGDTDGPSTADDVVFAGGALIAREGDPAPGVPGAAFSTFEPFQTAHQISAVGGLAYIATLRDVPLDNDRAVYKNTELIALEGTEAPGIAGRLFVDFSSVSLSDDGVVGFVADLDGSTGDDSVVYLGGLQIYREGDAVPGLPGETWDGNFGDVQWNGAGDLLLEGNTSLPTSMDWVLLRRRQTTEGMVEQIVAQEGQLVEAAAGADSLALLLQTAIAENGTWALRGNLAAAPSDADGVVISESGFFRQQGDPVDELPGVVLGNFNGVAVNSAGDVLYLADLEGDTGAGVDEGIFLNCCLIITDGAPAPGQPKGTMLSDLGFEDICINDSGQIAFAASYTGATSGDGLFTIACSSACPGDVDGDGAIDVDDLVAIILDWGSDGAQHGGDADGSGTVDLDDLVLVVLGWGLCTGGGA